MLFLITYNKKPDAQTLAYQDQFINQSIINMYSKYPRNLESKEIQNFKDKEITFHLFVKKSDDDGKSFIYLGTCQPQVDSFREKAMKRVDKKNNAKTVKVVSMNLKLTIPVDINTYYMLRRLSIRMLKHQHNVSITAYFHFFAKKIEKNTCILSAYLLILNTL